MMMTVARGAWVKWASSTPHAGIAASVPTATVSPSRTSRAMTHAISSSWVYRATSAVDVAVKVALERRVVDRGGDAALDRESTRLNSSHQINSYVVFCLQKKNIDE